MAATTARLTQAERRARMRRRLSRAAFEVIRDGGYVNFRTAAVSRVAGVSQGAQLHHFPTKNSLAEAAIEYSWEQATLASIERIDTFESGDDIVRALLDDSRAFFFSDYFRVALDILMAGGNEQALRDELVASTLKHRQRVERLWLERLIEEGWQLTHAEDVLALTMSLVRGFAIRALVEPDVARFDRLCDRWHDLIGASALAP